MLQKSHAILAHLKHQRTSLSDVLSFFLKTILTCECALRQSGVQFMLSAFTTDLRNCFTEPTLRLFRAQLKKKYSCQSRAHISCDVPSSLIFFAMGYLLQLSTGHHKSDVLFPNFLRYLRLNDQDQCWVQIVQTRGSGWIPRRNHCGCCGLSLQARTTTSGDRRADVYHCFWYFVRESGSVSPAATSKGGSL